MRYIPFLLFCALLFSIQSKAQRFTQFSSDSVLYIEEMETLFERSETNYKKGKELLEIFEEEVWYSGNIPEYRRNNVYLISNKLLKKKARNFPHFYEYINTLITFYKAQTDTANYYHWEQGLIHLLDQRKTKLRDLEQHIKSARYLLTKNAVYYSKSIAWYATTTNYKILFENDTTKYVFEETDLIGKLRRDSIIINKTHGVYYPLTLTWEGEEALVLWEKAGIDANTAYAEVGKYSINLKKTSYSIPKVKFYNKNFFDYPIIGTLNDKIVETGGRANISYPRFESDEKAFKIEGLFEDINYKGGFSMKGSKFIGSGSPEQNAVVSIFREVELIREGDTIIEKQLFMKAAALHYTFYETEIVSLNAKVSMYIDKDSIYHPGLTLRYYDRNREINLLREDNAKNMSRSPYYDSYHQIELDPELIKWRLGENHVDFTMSRGSTVNSTSFESTNYFSAQRYYEVQGLEDLHPYLMLRHYSKAFNTQTFYDEDFAKYVRLPLIPVQNLLIELTFRGIVDYNNETRICTIKEKMYNYLDAIVGQRDYDLINFESRTYSSQNNATLNLKNMDLAINGVPVINVSDSQNVVFYPANQQILLKKNRDFDFSGRIEAGLFNYYGENFEFKYDSFRIELNKVDSLTIKVKAGVDDWGRRVLANVESVIETVSGNIVIDDPGNKSGVKSFPEYPYFESTSPSFVYYNDYTIQDGKYPKESFYFKIDSYRIDSLNNFSTEGMGYDGEFYSSDIFPSIRERLVLRPDNSLGFVHKVPEGGYPAYKGKGQYYTEIDLSHRGLRGDGILTYLTSNTMSEDFIFYPDSMNTNTVAMEIGLQNTNVQYPDIKSGEVYVHWMPYIDEYHSNTMEEPFVMYNAKGEHKGTILYTPDGITGSGSMDYYKAKLSSNMFKFQSTYYNCDTASFELQSINSDKLALSTDSVRARVDFTALKSEFNMLNGTGDIELPDNLYTASIEQFNWLMEDKTMQFETKNTVQVYDKGNTRTVTREEAGLLPKGSLFISMHKGQDSLNWVSPIADFDLTTNIINAHQVKYIDVADASIFPFEEELTVHPLAKINTLTKAKVRANRTSMYHNFHEATINISSRKKYHGAGKYNYVDELGRELPINFDVLGVDSTQTTFARGTIKGTDDFSLSTAFNYRGKVDLYAPNQFLNFAGYVMMNDECDQIQETWVRFASEINPKDIYIPLPEEPQNINDKYLLSGPIMGIDSVHVYPAFLSERKWYSNLPIINAGEYLHYDSKAKTYEIGSKIRIQNDDTTGNYMSLHKNYCNLYGQGEVSLGAKLGQIKTRTVGLGNYKLPKNELFLDVFQTVDFFIPDLTLKYISDTLNTMTGLPNVSLKSKTYEKNLKMLMGSETALTYLKEQRIFGTVKVLPPALTTSFVFSELRLKWNDKARAWQSDGSIGISSINGAQINKKVKGHLEIDRKRSGDSFSLYLELGEGHWYFFTYKRGLMQTYSSERAYNDIIANTKGSDRKKKVERGETSYVFFLSNLKKRNDFLKHLGVGLDGNVEEVEENEDDYQQYEEFD